MLRLPNSVLPMSRSVSQGSMPWPASPTNPKACAASNASTCCADTSVCPTTPSTALAAEPNSWSKPPRIEHGRVRGETEEHIEYRQNDREVRATILRVIANRLRPPTEYSWSAYDFDFRNAYLEGVDFSNATFTGSAEFSRATFAGIAEFGDATFTRKAQFGGATFTSGAWFQNATFSSGAWFHGATFTGDVQFGEATFTRTAEFGEATFTGKIWFHYVTFAHSAWFNSATFTCDVSFNGAIFNGDVSFHDATFTGDARFMKVSFGSGIASFVAPRRWGPPTPVFDWDQDLSQKPANVEPRDWPPTVAVPPTPS
ncbi:pentapeptide repeat-containing protein [Nocardia gipuzkoensis]